MEAYCDSPFEQYRYPLGDRKSGPNGSTHIVTPDGDPYDLYKLYTYDAAFKFESEDLREIIAEVHPGNTATTNEM